MVSMQQSAWREGLVAAGLAGTLVGLVFAPALLSISLIVVVAASIILSPDGPLGFIPRALSSSLCWGLAGLYLLLLAGAPQTEEWGYYLERLRIKIPLLLLPLAWAALPFGTHWAARAGAVKVNLAWVGFVAVVAASVLINYALHFPEFNELIRQGQPLPVPRDNHIRFSLLVALASVVGADGYLRYRSRWLLMLGLFCFLTLHLLAVRTGLATAYAGWAVVMGGWALRSGRYGYLAAGLLGLLALPVLAYLTVPSFQTKMNYMRYELLHRDVRQDTAQYSDQGRLTSIRLGLEVWREHPVLGVGQGNLQRVMNERYAARYPGVEPKRPHNQFVTALAGSGVVGFVITVGCFFLIGYADGRWRDPRYAAIWVMLTLSCLVENTLETSVGVTLFTVFLLAFAYPPKRKPG
ncbi:O-antigen ligase family protein [Neolewinella litorea]|uniref:O-antigen ligase domain-containing protein n=1 Tax=Neolewinella litorea TaxID=2562452 RepID=A0A4S4NRK8_9BACT|nr:O-antigen ligase family protein [Neolewinella litorea]THH41845.1 O-antigen ligase domain-containing protein [Neolewinella litorea]